jgi:hypothetical protein
MSGSALGFAGVSAFGQHGTTGGLGGPEITVRDASSLLSAIREPGPAIVRVDGAFIAFRRRVRAVSPRTGATANQDWIANSPAVQDATAPASKIRPPTSSEGDFSVRRHPPRGTGDVSARRPATVDRRTHTPAGNAPKWAPRTGRPSVE